MAHRTRSMVTVVFLSLLAPTSGVACFVDDCSTCLDVEDPWGTYYMCYWCKVDNQCHLMGNIESPCYKASNDQCISKSALSSCTSSHCPAGALNTSLLQRATLLNHR